MLQQKLKEMREQEPFKSMLANTQMLQRIYSQTAATQKIMHSLQTPDIAAGSQSMNVTAKILNNSLALRYAILKNITKAHFSTPIFYNKTIFLAAIQSILAQKNTQDTLNAISNTYSSEFMKKNLNIDWQKIAFSSNPTLKIFNELLVAEANVQGSIDNEEIEIPPIPAEVEAEIGKLFNKLVSRVGKHQKILRNIFFCFILPIVVNVISSRIDNRLFNEEDNSKQIIFVIQCLGESLEKNIPKEPQGYLRMAIRRTKFTTRDNHTIWLNPGDKIIVECDIKKRVYGTIVIDGKFIKGHCLKKYTRKMTDASDTTKCEYGE